MLCMSFGGGRCSIALVIALYILCVMSRVFHLIERGLLIMGMIFLL